MSNIVQSNANCPGDQEAVKMHNTSNCHLTRGTKQNCCVTFGKLIFDVNLQLSNFRCLDNGFYLCEKP